MGRFASGRLRPVFAIVAAAIVITSVVAITRGSQASPERLVGAPHAGATGQECKSSRLVGPSRAPAGAVIVKAGSDVSLFKYALPTHKTYFFESGTHTLGNGSFAQIDPGSGDTFIGAPGAVLAGQWKNNYAFALTGAGTTVTGVTIEYLTVKEFDPPEGQGAVNQGAGKNWTVEYDTIEDNAPGAGLMIGTNNVVEHDCLTDNGEYGFDAYVGPTDPSASSLTHGPSNITLSDNEVSYNDTCNWEAVSPDPVPPADVPANCKKNVGQYSGCGCSGGGKFWQTDGATITGNDVHNNYDVGIWADTDNTGFDVSGNSFANNWSVGYQEEISYNFSITDNTFIDNAWGAGPTNAGFPEPAIYVSESGGDDQVPGRESGVALISGNTFVNNWSGVVLWQNSGRYCSDGYDDACTLINPPVFTRSHCAANLATAVQGAITGDPPADYWNGCLWKTQNVHVTGNTFTFTRADIPGCKLASDSCGQNALFSQYGTSPVPYDHPPFTISNDISNFQHNVFSDNTYVGPWSFVGFSFSPVLTFTQWRRGVADADQSGDRFGPQDAGSTYNTSVSAPPSITSAASTIFTVGAHGTFRVTATGDPTPSLSETGRLPSGVTFTDNGNGTATLSGTPAGRTGGTYAITLEASISTQHAKQRFLLTVDEAPKITTRSSTTFYVGSFHSFKVTASGWPAPSLSEHGKLPKGVSFRRGATGARLAGTAASGTSGTYRITIKATNGEAPTALQHFVLIVKRHQGKSAAATTSRDSGDSRQTSGRQSAQAGGRGNLACTSAAELLQMQTVVLTGRLPGGRPTRRTSAQNEQRCPVRPAAHEAKILTPVI